MTEEKDIVGQNTGVIEVSPKPEDWKAGEISGIQYEDRLVSWRDFLPTNERQYTPKFDTNFCVTFSGLNALETQLNYLFAKGKFSAQAVAFFTNEGYLDENKKFNLNECFNASLNGTTINGNSLPAFWDSIRKVGAIPQKRFTQIDDAKVWNDLVKKPSQDLLDLGLKFLEYVNIQYEWVIIKEWNQSDVPGILKYHDKHAPCQLAAPVCPMWSRFTLKEGDIVKSCPSIVPQHGTMQFAVTDEYINTYDTYNPFIKNLALDYPIPYAVKGVVTVKTPPITQKFQFLNNLQKGMTHKDVKELQKRLNAEGFVIAKSGAGSPGKESNFFGDLTLTQVKNYQKTHGISPVAGYFGIITRTFMNTH